MAARLIERGVHNVPGRFSSDFSSEESADANPIPGKMRVAELFFEVPVNYSKPNEGTLRLFARGVSRINKPVEPSKEESKLPWLVYLQGGPGCGCSAPQNLGWIEPALTKGYQVRDYPACFAGLSCFTVSRLFIVLTSYTDSSSRPAWHWFELDHHCRHPGSSGGRNQAG